MHFLDIEVPVEVVGIIAHHLVCAGIHDAWKARGVCCTDIHPLFRVNPLTLTATLRGAIDDDILLHQTKDVLRPGDKIMEHMMPRYLAQRVKTRLDVEDALPIRVSMMHTYLCKELGFTKTRDQERCLQTLCTGLKTVWEPPFLSLLLWGHESASASLYSSLFPEQLIFGPWQKTPTLLVIQDKVLAAIAVDDCILLGALLPQFTGNGFDYPSHQPLTTALKTKNDKLLNTLLAYLATPDTGGCDKWTAFSVEQAVQKAFSLKMYAEGAQILNNFHASGARMEKYAYLSWVKIALPLQDVSLIQAVCKLRTKEPCYIPTAMFKEICKTGNIDIVKAVLKGMNLNSGTIRTLPLHIAIKTENLELIEAVLDAGADINVRAYKATNNKDYMCPIDVAMNHKGPELELLIKRGVIIPHISQWNLSNATTYEILRKAVLAEDPLLRYPSLRNLRKMDYETILKL
jgi:hypothetical protein